MSSARSSLLAGIYFLLALAGAATALYYGLPYWTSPDATLAGFGRQAFETAPGRVLGADLTVVYILANLFILVEGRRLGLRHLWIYVLANTTLAVAVGLPLFLGVRERRLSSRRTP